MARGVLTVVWIVLAIVVVVLVAVIWLFQRRLY